MNDNHLPDDDLLQLVFGELDAKRQAAVRKALAKDAELAATARGLEAAVVAVRAENVGHLSDQFNDRLRQRMSEVFDHAEPETTRPTFLTRSPARWRWIMRSPVSRVAAAAIFVFAVAGVALWFHGGGAAPAFADFLQPILEAKTVKYKLTTELKGMSKAILTTEVMKLNASQSRSELVMELPDKSLFKTVQIWDGTQAKSLHLDLAKKRATLYDYVNRPKDEHPTQEPFAGFRAMLLDAQSKPHVKRESLGEKTIDGRRVVGFRIKDPGAVIDVWGDPETGLPVRIESTVTMPADAKLTMSDFEFNVDLDESLFSVEPPADYEVTVIQKHTSDGKPSGEEDLIEMFREYSRWCAGLLPDLIDFEWVTGTFRQQEWLDASIGQKRDERRQEFSDSDSKLQRGLSFALRLPKQSDSHYAGRGVRVGTADTPIFWYRPKDSKKYRVIYADLSVRDAETPPSMPDAPPTLPEQGLIDLFSAFGQSGDGHFPFSLDQASLLTVFTTQQYSYSFRVLKKPQEARAKKEREEAVVKLQRGLWFIALLPEQADSHYAGKGVPLGKVDTPIYWYRPKDSKKYRVIYADLSVAEADAPPSVPDVQPEQDLIDMLRHYSDLSSGPFPLLLDLQTMTQAITQKFIAEKVVIQMLLETFTPENGKLNQEQRLKIEELAHKIMDSQNLAAGKEMSNQKQMLEEQMLKLADWELLAPGKEKLNDEQKLELLEARMKEATEALMPKYMEVQMPKILETTMKFQAGSKFVVSLPPEADAHYAGKGVSLGAAHKPIFWYRPKDAKKYRVIYADLSVREAETPPSVPDAQPVPAPSSPKK